MISSPEESLASEEFGTEDLSLEDVASLEIRFLPAFVEVLLGCKAPILAIHRSVLISTRLWMKCVQNSMVEGKAYRGYAL